MSLAFLDSWEPWQVFLLGYGAGALTPVLVAAPFILAFRSWGRGVTRGVLDALWR